MDTVPRNRFVPERTFFLTTNVLGRRPILTDCGMPVLVLETLRFFRRGNEIYLFGYVIMPDHIHLVVRLRGELLLPAFTRRFKSYVATHARRGPMWEKGCWTEMVGSQRGLIDTLHYVHNNPVNKLLAERPEEYPWSSARDYLSEAPSAEVDFWWATLPGAGPSL